MLGHFLEAGEEGTARWAEGQLGRTRSQILGGDSLLPRT